MYDNGPGDSTPNIETRIMGDALWIRLLFWFDKQFTFPWPIYGDCSSVTEQCFTFRAMIGRYLREKGSWRYGHGWTWALCAGPHRRYPTDQGSSPAADRPAVAQLSPTPVPPVRTAGVSAADGPADVARFGRPDVRPAAEAGGHLLATSLLCLWALFQRGHAGSGLAQRPLHPPRDAHRCPPGGRRRVALSNRQLAPLAGPPRFCSLRYRTELGGGGGKKGPQNTSRGNTSIRSWPTSPATSPPTNCMTAPTVSCRLSTTVTSNACSTRSSITTPRKRTSPGSSSGSRRL